MTSLCCPPVQVSAHYELIKEFDIAVPPIELAAFQMIEADLTALNDALYAAEANKEDNIVRFQKELDAEVGLPVSYFPSQYNFLARLGLAWLGLAWPGGLAWLQFLVVMQLSGLPVGMLVHLLSHSRLQHVNTDSEHSAQRMPSDYMQPGAVHNALLSLARLQSGIVQAQLCMQRASWPSPCHDSSKSCL